MNTDKLPLEIPSTAIQLDIILKRHIKNYLSAKGNNTVTLPYEIQEFVNDMYADSIKRANDSNNEKRIEGIQKDLQKNTPSRTLILNYYNKNGAICRSYINTLALFFNQPYTISKYNPSDDFETNYEP